MDDEKTYVPIELAREIFPALPNDVLEYILWNETAFPFCDYPTLRRHLKNTKRRMQYAAKRAAERDALAAGGK